MMKLDAAWKLLVLAATLVATEASAGLAEDDIVGLLHRIDPRYKQMCEDIFRGKPTSATRSALAVT